MRPPDGDVLYKVWACSSFRGQRATPPPGMKPGLVPQNGRKKASETFPAEQSGRRKAQEPCPSEPIAKRKAKEPTPAEQNVKRNAKEACSEQQSGKRKASKPSKFVSISSNIYRSDFKKWDKQHEVEEDVCDCRDFDTGCVERCCLRLLQIECNPTRCLHNDKCLNQRFQRQQYAKYARRFMGLKGFGIVLRQAVEAGDFIMEYMGEVITNNEVLKRLHRHRLDRHFYILSLNSQQSILYVTRF
eukprot:g1803.t1